MTDEAPRPEDDQPVLPQNAAQQEAPASAEDALPEDAAQADLPEDALPEDAAPADRPEDALPEDAAPADAPEDTLGEDDAAQDEPPPDLPEDAPAEDPEDDDDPAPKAGERIAKMMSRAGVASRRDAERMILEGRVSVNGTVIRSPALDILPTDRVVVDGKPMEAPQETRLWLYYKPVGLVTSEADEKGRQTVFDALPRDLPRVMTVGRLDLTSEGLLLLTNDGELKRRLELPATAWMRRYRVRVNGNPTELTFAPLRRGIEIEGEQFAPMEVEIDSQRGANAWLTVGIREGRNREIRRAMAHVGLTVNRLIRIGYGPFKLGDLEKNEVREVKRRVLRDQLGGLLPGQEEADERRAPAREERGDRRSQGRPDARGGERPRERWNAERRGETRGDEVRGKPEGPRRFGTAAAGERGPARRAGPPSGGPRPFDRPKRFDGERPHARRDAAEGAERRKPWDREGGQGGKPAGRRPHAEGDAGRPDRRPAEGGKPWARTGSPGGKPGTRPYAGSDRDRSERHSAEGGKPWARTGGPGGKPGDRRPYAEGDRDRSERRPAEGAKPWTRSGAPGGKPGDRRFSAEGDAGSGPRRASGGQKPWARSGAPGGKPGGREGGPFERRSGEGAKPWARSGGPGGKPAGRRFPAAGEGGGKPGGQGGPRDAKPFARRSHDAGKPPGQGGRPPRTPGGAPKGPRGPRPQGGPGGGRPSRGGGGPR